MGRKASSCRCLRRPNFPCVLAIAGLVIVTVFVSAGSSVRQSDFGVFKDSRVIDSMKGHVIDSENFWTQVSNSSDSMPDAVDKEDDDYFGFDDESTLDSDGSIAAEEMLEDYFGDLAGQLSKLALQGQSSKPISAHPNRLNIAWVIRPRDARFRYYTDLLQSLKNIHRICLRKCLHSTRELEQPCGGSEVDVVVIGYGCLQPLENPSRQLVFMLNKEYGDLSPKIRWALLNKPMVSFTVHHHFAKFTRKTNVPFYRLPFAVDPNIFDVQSLNPERDYTVDFGFTGSVHPGQRDNWRGRILKELRPALEKSGLTVFHARWLSFDDYRETISKTKVWLSTFSRGDIVNPRYFEVMASGTTVLACNHDTVGAYEGLGFEDGVNVIMFRSLDELHQKLIDLSTDSDKRAWIVKNARELVLKHHTYAIRADQWTSQVVEGLSMYRDRLWGVDEGE